MPARKQQSGAGALSDAFNFIKRNQLISKGLSMVPHPMGQTASIVAKQLGLGRPKRKTKPRKTMVGRGIFSDLGGGVGNVFHGIGGGLFGGAKKKRRVGRSRAILV